MEKRFALAYVQKQFSTLPVPADDASDAEKQGYAREKVKVDAIEVQIEHETEYREFIRTQFGV